MRLTAAVLTFLWTSPALAQSEELEVVCFEVGTGDATLIISPSGRTMLIDGGPTRTGNEVILPFLRERDIQHLDYICASHYHTDHVGGLDELAKSGLSIGEVIDRGDVDAPNLQPFRDYQSAMAGLRRDAVPGEWIDLGEGVRLKCLSSNGRLAGGAVIDLAGTAQQENSASISWLLSYGDFQMFVGGDLTGGSAASVNVERPVGVVCGDVDVYRVNMHGSALSSTNGFVQQLQPEFAIISVSSPNGSNFPRSKVIQRLSTPDRAIPIWSTSSGNGGYGFVDAGGTITLRTDGRTYSAYGADGLNLTAWCDEVPTIPYPENGVAISEFHRDSGSVRDYNGEWIELTGVYSAAPCGLRGTRMVGGLGEEFTFGINLRLDAGKSIVVGANGIPAMNGDYRPTLAWPEGIIALDQGNTTIAVVAPGEQEIDRLNYTGSWPGGSGVSCERVDSLLEPDVSNWAASTSAYGNGDLGTPGARNSQEVTNWFPGGSTWIGFENWPSIGKDLLLVAEMPGESGALYQAALALGISPGTWYNGTHIPINQDHIFDGSTREMGWLGYVPQEERIELSIAIPARRNLVGSFFFAIIVTADSNGTLRSWARPTGMPIFDF